MYVICITFIPHKLAPPPPPPPPPLLQPPYHPPPYSVVMTTSTTTTISLIAPSVVAPSARWSQRWRRRRRRCWPTSAALFAVAVVLVVWLLMAAVARQVPVVSRLSDRLTVKPLLAPLGGHARVCVYCLCGAKFAAALYVRRASGRRMKGGRGVNKRRGKKSPERAARTGVKKLKINLNMKQKRPPPPMSLRTPAGRAETDGCFGVTLLRLTNHFLRPRHQPLQWVF